MTLIRKGKGVLPSLPLTSFSISTTARFRSCWGMPTVIASLLPALVSGYNRGRRHSIGTIPYQESELCLSRVLFSALRLFLDAFLSGSQ